ncbi:CheB methylesterase domain-containing protein [Paracoccus rhizosphaerae]|uniref:protein-glutamate methylesterase n=1 Tax=Paracoccus rhizosphaerae TaxID=1133347 RepID=A0ABV6CRA4_9RHOB|nr:CheB methylesterase domain-containing protein [Paracoccus rhizosphaerae]
MPKAILLIADPNAARRMAIRRCCEAGGNVAALPAATLGEAYVLIEKHLPRRVAIASELADMPEFEMLSDMLAMIEADVVIFKEGQGGTNLDSAAERLAATLIRDLGGWPAVTPRGPSVSPATTAPFDSVILIGASTGGITALEAVLGTFPDDCPPTLVVQHIRPGFAEGLVRRLDQLLAPTVVAALDATPLRRGTIYLAAAPDQHLTVELRGGVRTRLLAGPAVSGHRPSVDVLFSEAAALAGRIELRAAILTGMGADGAEGMCRLRRAGAATIAQDRETSVVWGMPRMAVEMGGAAEVLPLGRIGAALLGRETTPARFAS